MTEERNLRASAFSDLLRSAGLKAGPHPPPERLLEYQEGLLGEPEAEVVRDHLALCSECTRMVLELASTLPPELPARFAPLSDEQMAEVWPAIRQRLPLSPPIPLEAGRPRRLVWRIALPLVASVLLATTLASSYWAWSMLRESRRLADPRVNVAIENLVPTGQTDIRGDGDLRKGVPPRTDAVLLVLNMADLRPFPVYGAEIREGLQGPVLWSSDQLQRNSRGNFTVQLLRPFPGSGLYRIRLFGIDGQRRELLAEYEADLRAKNRW
jgi:hypothetical protein